MIRRFALALCLLGPLLSAHAMVDHLLSCATEVACQQDAAIGKYWTLPSADNPSGSWRGDVTIPNVNVYQIAGDGSQLPFPGWFINIALPSLDPNLILAADRDAANADQPFLLKVAPSAQVDLNIAHVSPTFAGSNYPFGGVSPP